jgi:hypothetical protein
MMLWGPARLKMDLRRGFSAMLGSWTSAARGIRTPADGLQPRLAGIGGARCSRYVAISIQKAERAGCMTTVGVCPAAGPLSQGLRGRANDRAAPLSSR